MEEVGIDVFLPAMSSSSAKTGSLHEEPMSAFSVTRKRPTLGFAGCTALSTLYTSMIKAA